MAFTPFPPRQPSSSARLPLTLMTLDDWALATISGPDSEKISAGADYRRCESSHRCPASACRPL
ncbi:Folate-dependent protein for Fe/S cluster synthesis/repair in oxidative stress [Klebsiella pneumoniae IS46]|uniref:Folate-dependent protein for Fe/S cluster synthesis/repair in oxidative stress n=1 Tax=Klebsiella pneumoniae IS43 TaxID=1432552 RepID=W1DHQ4_KLEPN|nr:Folate-dependent protein for Fe/S cluster synthesis/repair in oxidative stress [Klebsiella pneumoniae IS43]CDL14647.1 Folate-dependent protein for Fe/S cluster synthesis/repair in oxidative stress [Klebsiella pneumoniae IS46]CDL21052.1 Folate-dependent protein for Fe/S cluster synthesis/repair in oxidative stress [Klebsiella pneumoniae IS53]CDL46208.1 Folate-dependent protein for Fe/S cluster synthesis/repair in oxidative stress [Klebsiella pneumoniae ISC21]CDL61585.1 Folate-dependent protei